MAKRVGGFINQDGLNAPDEPTGVSASSGDAEATVSFTAPSDVGASAITGYVATSNDGIGAAGSSSPITVSGLTNDSSYTFRVWAINAFGWSAPSDSSGSVTPVSPRALIAGGEQLSPAAAVNIINYVTISTTGNATDFGDLITTLYKGAAVSSSTRGVFGAGNGTNVMSYVTIMTTGNSTDFGDLNLTQEYGGCSNETRGLFFGNTSNTISYITIATTGNSTDFGDMLFSSELPTGCASPSRGIMWGGSDGAGNNTINYVTIASTGNATDFGDLLYAAPGDPGSCSSDTRGVIAAGSATNTINYITIASTGNATDFGDLANNISYGPTGTGSKIRGLFAGGSGWTGGANTIAYITIASTGNSTDFGDLLYKPVYHPTACSNSHGGLA